MRMATTKASAEVYAGCLGATSRRSTLPASTLPSGEPASLSRPFWPAGAGDTVLFLRFLAPSGAGDADIARAHQPLANCDCALDGRVGAGPRKIARAALRALHGGLGIQVSMRS